jgi:tetratricopeptide (TPR) repeat protein
MHNLASAIKGQGRYKEAEELFREVLEILQRVQGKEHPYTLDSMHGLACAIRRQGRYEEAERRLRDLLEIERRVRGPEHPVTLDHTNCLAECYTGWCWRLATAADVSQRDPAKAAELAKLAIELEPDDANHWNNLGVAQYRAGNWQAAVDALEKADSMIETGDRVHRMFFAMAHWQLGDKEKARELYAQGAAWIASHRKNSDGQRRFRAEAEELMEITEEERNRLVEEYLARPADKATEAPNEKPDENGTEGGDQGAEDVKPAEPATGP